MNFQFMHKPLCVLLKMTEEKNSKGILVNPAPLLEPGNLQKEECIIMWLG